MSSTISIARPRATPELSESVYARSKDYVLYKGDSLALLDKFEDKTFDMIFADLATVRPHAASGKVRVLALCGSKRSASAPGIATISESALKGYAIEPWFGVVGPANLPRDIVARLNQMIQSGLKAADSQQRLASLGYDAIGGSPEQFAATIKADLAVYARIVKAAGIKTDL